MKLFYKPGACSMASHIVLHELGVSFEIEAVDTATGTTVSGADYSKINAKGYVPALQMKDGSVLTEGPSILQYLADAHPEATLLPPAGSLDRARVIEVLTYVSSELHKAFGPLFNPATSKSEQDAARASVATKFDHVETLLQDGRGTITSGGFTIADAYLFVVSNWANGTGIDLTKWPNLSAYVARIAQRPATQMAMRAEGLTT